MMPREKLMHDGPDSLSDAELLAIFLGTGVPGVPVTELAAELIDEFNGLRGLMNLDQQDLLQQPGIGVAKYAKLAAALEMSKRYLKSGLDRGENINDPTITKQFLLLKMRHYVREVFACLFLDNQHRLITFEELFYGTIDGASVYPREVLRRSLEVNAAAVIFAHNHPSGIAEPSAADRRITERLKSALDLVEIRVLDHLIVGDTEVTSFAELGLL